MMNLTVLDVFTSTFISKNPTAWPLEHEKNSSLQLLMHKFNLHIKLEFYGLPSGNMNIHVVGTVK